MKSKTRFVCQECGQETVVWYGKCPGCGQFNTLVEEVVAPPAGTAEHINKNSRQSKPIAITDVASNWQKRYLLGIREWDNVLGGGLVPGSLTLLGGDPGIGKSTLVLQVAGRFARQFGVVLYISGEESAQQIRLRAERLQTLQPQLIVLAETDIEAIEQQIHKVAPELIIIDSIQTVFSPELTAPAGSVSQVRYCAAKIMQLAKSEARTVILIGHVTKDGGIAGPRVLEHMVDTVLHFEGDRNHVFRILRTIKNRFGSTNELGVFEMSGSGLNEVSNPSNLFFSPREAVSAPTVSGSVVTAALEGIRPLLLEVQALVSPTGYAAPRRMTTGMDFNRVAMIMAVLDKRLGLQISRQDVYVNVVGGVKIDEPAIDLAIALAVVSSLRNHPLDLELLVVGEIGLTGEIRPVNLIEKRISEAEKMGFNKAIVPYGNLKQLQQIKKFKCIGVKTIAQAVEASLL